MLAKKYQTFSLYWVWVIFIFWLLFFFPRWYVLSYTKLWELKQLVGRSWEQQVMVMHPAEMDRLLQLKSFISAHQKKSSVAVVLFADSPLVQAKNAPLVSGILGSDVPLYSEEVLPPSDRNIIILIDGSEVDARVEAWKVRYPQAEIIGWEVVL